MHQYDDYEYVEDSDSLYEDSYTTASSSRSSLRSNKKVSNKKWIEEPQNETNFRNRDYIYSNLNRDYVEYNGESYEPDEDHNHLSYCYLCSIKAHVHKKTEPVPLNKRRYLKPYINPVQLMRKYEKNQFESEIKTKYKFLVKTGAGSYAGTNSAVWFKLFGTAGTWESTELKGSNLNKELKFPPNSLVELELNGPVIGDLKKIKIWHDGKSIKDGWYLEYIEITSYKLKQVWRFVCDQWICLHRPPNLNPIVLSLSNSLLNNERFRNSTEYTIVIKTANKPLISNEDTNVQFQFVGSKGQSQVFNLLTPYIRLFEKNQMDAFLIMSSVDLGKPEKLRMAHNQRKMQQDWAIEEIKIMYSRDPNKFYVFKLDKWLDKNQKLNAIITPNRIDSIDPQANTFNPETGKRIYYVSVITNSQLKLAGTEARVFIEINGSNGNSAIHRLHNPKAKAKKEFARGKTSHFHIIDVNVGKLKAIRIWHDNSGSAPGWLLDAVLVRSVPTTFTGKKEQHDAELRDQLEIIRKKIKIRDLKLEPLISDKKPKIVKRSKSVDLFKSKRQAKTKILTKGRSLSADSKKLKLDSKSNLTKADGNEKIKYTDILKQNLERSNSGPDISRQHSPTPSILKTSSSPRSRNDMMRKSVKFNEAENKTTSITNPDKNQQTTQETEKSSTAPKIEMNLNWIMSLAYAEQNVIKEVKSIENYDKTIKNIDIKLVEKLDQNENQPSKKLTKAKSIDEDRDRDTKSIPAEINGKKVEDENLIYVFECKKWLSIDPKLANDKKIERILKVTNILNAK